jgi:hypothetical protein
MRIVITEIYNSSGQVIGYVRVSRRGRWYAINHILDLEYRRGGFADRTEAIVAVLSVGDQPPPSKH